MSKNIILLTLLAAFIQPGFAQRPALEMTFTAINNAVHIQLDSIKIINRTQDCDTVLYWPDTVLTLNFVGIPDMKNPGNEFQIIRNFPNPVKDQTAISLYVPGNDEVSIIITDILGRVMLISERIMEKGYHSFRFTPGVENLYFFTARWRGMNSSIKILHIASGSNKPIAIDYLGAEVSSLQLKATQEVQDFSFNLGDELLFIGYINSLQSGVQDNLEESKTYIFQFATNITCPGTPTVEYEGQVYNTIQIFSQCWLKENLNVGTMVTVDEEMTNNGILEKYCYNDEPDSCTKYGGLYQWWEMMQYTTQEGKRCICPPGWHLPTDMEWQVLEGAVDSQYGIGDPVWNLGMEVRGFDAGLNLKSSTGWNDNNNWADLFGFSGLPGGTRIYAGFFYYIGEFGRWWTSSSYYDYPWFRNLEYGPGVYRYNDTGLYGFSVRCVKDNQVSQSSLRHGGDKKPTAELQGR